MNNKFFNTSITIGIGMLCCILNSGIQTNCYAMKKSVVPGKYLLDEDDFSRTNQSQSPSSSDLARRQEIVKRQLEEHERLNKRNGPSETFYQAILKEEKFEPMYGFPGIVLDTEPLRELNKQANHAKHDWKNTFGSNTQYQPQSNYQNQSSYSSMNSNSNGRYTYPADHPLNPYYSSNPYNWK